MNKNLLKNSGILILSLILITGMLLLPKVSLNLALAGLNLWFTKMIPTLFPFMVISGILIRMNLIKPLCAPFRSLFRFLFGVEENGIFCIFIGFLCGFPMGAKVISDLYKRGELSFAEADYLLSFCNNIGPIYFCSFVLTTLNVSHKFPYLFGMYGLPIAYSLVLRCFSFFKKRSAPLVKGQIFSVSLHEKEAPDTLLSAIDGSIISAIESITKLGGYMIFFNLFNMLPRILMQKGLFSGISYVGKVKITHFFSCLFEISNGVNLVKNKEPWLVLTMIPFGGLCCMAQTYSLIKDTPLSIAKYGLHKLLLAFITGIYYYFMLYFTSTM